MNTTDNKNFLGLNDKQPRFLVNLVKCQIHELIAQNFHELCTTGSVWNNHHSCWLFTIWAKSC